MSTDNPIRRPRRILWLNVLTVVSAAILISAEVFGAAFAGSWAIASLVALGSLGARILDVMFMLCGLAVMVQFVRAAHRVEPFTRGLTQRRAAARTAKFARYVSLKPKRLRLSARMDYFDDCPISHVPVAVCRSVGIRTRGRTAA